MASGRPRKGGDEFTFPLSKSAVIKYHGSDMFDKYFEALAEADKPSCKPTQYDSLPRSVSQDRAISLASKFLYVEMLQYRKKGDRDVFVNLNYTGDRLGMHPTTVSWCLKELIARGHIRKTRGGRYFLTSDVVKLAAVKEARLHQDSEDEL